MTGNLSKHKKNIDNIYTKAEVDRRIKSATDEKVDELTKIIDKATENIESDIAQKADKDSVDAEISGVNVALERIKYYGSADAVPSDESWFTVNSTGETITGLTDTGKTQTELVIPYEINGKKITKLEGTGSLPPPSILNGNNVITKIIIPNSVTSIGDFAFIGSSLTSINIPNSVTSIGLNAFESCSSLTSINIPNSVTSIESFAFDGCTALTKIEIPNSVTSIGTFAFSNCSSLTSINIPNSVTNIGDIAFSDCTSLTSINIPNSVTSIGHVAFKGCTSLTSINIPKSVTSIRDYAFEGCTSLTSVNIPRVTYIGFAAFKGCTSLTSINIPNSVIRIEYDAFRDCTNLKIYCEQGSYAETYAKDNNIPVVYTDITDEPTFRSMTVNGDINFIGGNGSNRVGMNGVYIVDYEVTAVDTSIPKEHHLTHKADTAEVLTKTNTTEFTPTADYQPATKKYVDEAISAYDTEVMALLGGDAE